MNNVDYTTYENFKIQNESHGVIFEGKMYEFGTKEFENLINIEGAKEKYKGTLLGLYHEANKK